MQHRDRRIVRHRRNLGAPQLAGGLLDRDQVGERSSGIDAHEPRAHLILLTAFFIALSSLTRLASATCVAAWHAASSSACDVPVHALGSPEKKACSGGCRDETIH